MKIELSSRFRKAYRKLAAKKSAEAVIALEKIVLFSQQPNSPLLRLHKLKGEFEGLYAFSIAYDLRVVVDLSKPDIAIMVDIGSHDEVY